MQEFKRNKPSIEKTEANLSLYTLEKGIPYKIDVTEGLEGDTDLSSLEIQAIEKGGPWGTLSVKKFFTSGSTRDEEHQLFGNKTTLCKVPELIISQDNTRKFYSNLELNEV